MMIFAMRLILGVLCVMVIILTFLYEIQICELEEKFKNNLRADSQIISSRTFTIDYEHHTFLKDGEPFRYISGSLHYQRIPRAYWIDRLLKAKAMGLDAIETYVPWNFHEMQEEKYLWEDDRDLISFLKLAHSLDLLVILRVGPYICAEWDFGGLPGWLLAKNATMNIRSSDREYLRSVERWFTQLLLRVRPLLYSLGGPIIMIQLENEYGAYFTCDGVYLTFLYELTRSLLGDEIVLFTTDGNRPQELRCGAQERRMFATVDFGIKEATNPGKAFSALREFQPSGPLVNSEYYTGWPDHWGETHNTVPTEDLVDGLKRMWNYGNVSVNLYMLHGGTTFGFWHGADGDPLYQPFITSYDFDAPISEAGDTGNKFRALKEVIQQLKPHTKPLPIPQNNTKAAYGSLGMRLLPIHVLDLVRYSMQRQQALPNSPTRYPPTMEETGTYLGYLGYVTKLTSIAPSTEKIHVKWDCLADTAYVYVANDGLTEATFVAVVNRSISELWIHVGNYSNLIFLLANEGRVNYAKPMFNQVKGIVGNVTVNGQIQQWWTTHPVTTLLQTVLSNAQSIHSNGNFPPQGAFYQAVLEVHMEASEVRDTFFKLVDFDKGELFVNQHHLGRYWTTAGPQQTLYVPKSFFAPIEENESTVSSRNIITVLEWSAVPCWTDRVCRIDSVDRPILQKL